MNNQQIDLIYFCFFNYFHSFKHLSCGSMYFQTFNFYFTILIIIIIIIIIVNFINSNYILLPLIIIILISNFIILKSYFQLKISIISFQYCLLLTNIHIILGSIIQCLWISFLIIKIQFSYIIIGYPRSPSLTIVLLISLKCPKGFKIFNYEIVSFPIIIYLFYLTFFPVFHFQIFHHLIIIIVYSLVHLFIFYIQRILTIHLTLIDPINLLIITTIYILNHFLDYYNFNLILCDLKYLFNLQNCYSFLYYLFSIYALIAYVLVIILIQCRLSLKYYKNQDFSFHFINKIVLGVNYYF